MAGPMWLPPIPRLPMRTTDPADSKTPRNLDEFPTFDLEYYLKANQAPTHITGCATDDRRTIATE